MSDWHDSTMAIAHGVRRRVLEHVLKNNGGYLSQACSSAEIFAMLYGRVLRLGPSVAPLEPRPFTGVPGSGEPYLTGGGYNGPRSRRSTIGCSSPRRTTRWSLYATLIEVGRLAETGLEHFNKDGGTVEMIGAEHSPGVETTTGSLAQALTRPGHRLGRKRRGEIGPTSGC